MAAYWCQKGKFSNHLAFDSTTQTRGKILTDFLLLSLVRCGTQGQKETFSKELEFLVIILLLTLESDGVEESTSRQRLIFSFWRKVCQYIDVVRLTCLTVQGRSGHITTYAADKFESPRVPTVCTGKQ